MKLVCVGRNYADHAKELKNETPDKPLIFIKPKSALLLPDKPLYYPEFTDDLHYECELVVKIHKNGRFIQEKFAHKYYNEVSLGIDFTARDVQRELQKKGLPWELAKGFDGSAAVGRFISLSPERTVQNLNFQLKHNGKLVQDGYTKDMLFTVDQVIAYVSQFFTLNIGDLLYTGTPAGVGPVSTGDKLEGFLLGDKVLEVDIK